MSPLKSKIEENPSIIVREKMTLGLSKTLICIKGYGVCPIE
jgi:hypothetical protein